MNVEYTFYKFGVVLPTILSLTFISSSFSVATQVFSWDLKVRLSKNISEVCWVGTNSYWNVVLLKDFSVPSFNGPKGCQTTINNLSKNHVFQNGYFISPTVLLSSNWSSFK